MTTAKKEFVPSPQQADFFNWVKTAKGNAILEAVAGAGKTTTIVKATEFMRGHVFLGAYNKKMADDLKARVMGRTGVFANTFHGAGYKALKYAFKNEALVIDDKKVAKLVEEHFMVSPDQKWLFPASVAIIDIVSMAKQRGIGALCPMDADTEWLRMIEHFGLTDELPEDFEDQLLHVVDAAKRILRRSNQLLSIIDFDDMVYLPLEKKLRMLQNDWVLIDEAQDTNPTRRALAKKMLKPGGRLVAVGDPHQAIFGFTGADNDSLEQLAHEFHCVRMPLTVSYRCPKAVVRHAQKWVSHITSHESAEEGEVVEVDYKDVMAQVQVGDAILCRYNKYLVDLCFKLIRAGKPARIEGRAIGEGLVKLASKWKVKTIEALRDKVETYMEREVKKAIDKGQEARADQITDKCETIIVLLDRAEDQGFTTTEQFREMVRSTFDDKVVNAKDMVTLCSMHRSKGLEWERVWLLGRSQFQPATMRQEWQTQQEVNLIYVGVTRSKHRLHEIINVPQPSAKEQREKKLKDKVA